MRRAVLTLLLLGGVAVGAALALDRAGLLPESIDRWLPELPATDPDSPAEPADPDAVPAETPAP